MNLSTNPKSNENCGFTQSNPITSLNKASMQTMKVSKDRNFINSFLLKMGMTFIFFLSLMNLASAQAVGIVGLNHDPDDGFALVALEDIDATTAEKVFFTDMDYVAASNTLDPATGDVVQVTWTGVWLEGTIIRVVETAADVFTVSVSTNGPTGAAASLAVGTGFSMSNEAFIAFSSSDLINPHLNINEIYSWVDLFDFAEPNPNDDPDCPCYCNFLEADFVGTDDHVNYKDAERVNTFDPASFAMTGNWDVAGTNMTLSLVEFTDIAACASTTFTAPADLCLNAGIQMGLSGGFPSGGVYTGLGVNDNGDNTYDFDPTVGGPGTVTITYTESGSPASDDVEVFALPTCSASNNGPICAGSDVTLNETGGDATSWAWSSDGSATFDNASAQSPVASGAVNGEVFTVMITDANGCTSSCMTTVTVNALPTCAASNNGPICAGGDVTLNETGGDATSWAWSSDGSATFDNASAQSPVASGAVNGELFTVMITDANGCTSSCMTTVTVNALPTCAASNNGPICPGADVTLNETGGDATSWAWSSDGSATFDNASAQSPVASGAVNGEVFTVMITDANGCTSSCMTTVTVNAAPTCSASNNGPICTGDDVTLNETGGDATSWAWSSNGSATFDNASAQSPVASGAVNNEEFTVMITDANGCTSSCMTTITVNALPTCAASNNGPICAGDDVTLNETGGDATSWAWSSDGSATFDNASAQSPVASGAVNGEVFTVMITDASGCSSSCMTTVTVNALPTCAASNNGPVCAGDDVTLNETGGDATSWAWSSDGSATFDNASAQSPVASGAVNGEVFTVMITDANGCTSSCMTTVTVNALPSVSFTAPADLCIDAGVQAGLGGGTPLGGTYSGPGVSDNGDDTYDFDPMGAGVGVHTLTYTVTDGNGCEGTATDMVEVFALPVVTLMTPMEVCITAGVMTFDGGAPTGGTYTGGPGVSDNGNGTDYDFDPAAAGLGTTTVTYSYTDANGCSGSAMSDIEVVPPQPVTLTIPPDQDTMCIDAGLTVIVNAGSPAGGVYSGDGVTDDGNGMSFTFDPAASGSGLILITYTFDGGAGCSGSFTDFIHVFDLPVVTFSIPADQDTFCMDDAVEVIMNAGGPAGGVYTGPGVTDDGNGTSFTFDPASAGTGFHVLTYTYTDDIGCSNSFDDFIQVLELPTVAFTAPADLCVDAGVQAGLGGGTPSGGVYSGAGVTDNGDNTYDFDPATAGVGVHTITYTYSDAEGCSDSASDDVEVFALPVVAFTAPADLCVDAGVQAGLGGGTPTGGVYSGAGVTDDGNGETYSFDPAAAGVGVHTITYDYTDSNGCMNSASDDVEVFALPVVTFTALADLCIDAGVQAGEGGGTPTGGVYSGTGVTDNGDGETYDFDPATAGVGVHTITYTYTDANGCTNSASDDVEVFALPVVTFTALADLCVDAGVQAGLGGGTPTGGVYSGTGVTDDGNGMTYSFDPATAGVGVHTITYTYTDGNGCTDSASDDVEVFALPVVAFTAPADLCVDAGVQAGLGGGTPTGGVYSGAGVTDDGNGETYSFDPAAAGVGVHTITYDYTDGNGCMNSASDDVEVFALPVVTFTALADLCIDAGVQAGEGGGTPTGGVYSGTGVTDNGDGETYDFDPATAGVGVHTITYTYTDANGCTDSASDDVEVFALPVVTFTALADLCVDAGVQAGEGGGTPTGGVYSGPGVTDNGDGETYDFDPATAGVGVHTITYTYTDGNGCTDSASDDVEVFALPVVAFTALADLCVDAGVQAGLGGGTPTGGVYSGAGVTDDGNGETYSFDPAAAGVGVHTITYDYTDGNGCMNSASDDVEVFALPVVTFTALADLCIDAGVQAGEGGGTPTGGVYSGTGVTDNGDGETYDFDPATAGVGVHTITYTYTDGNGCTDSASDDVEVFALPVVAFTALADLCVDAGVQAGEGGGTPTGGVYSGPGVTDNGDGETYDFDPATAGVGVHTITYTYTDGNGCTDSASDDVEVFALPVVAFTAPADLCVDAGLQAGLGGGTPTGGVYSGAGVTDDGNGETYSFDPAAAGVGVHTITYDYTDGNGCTGSASDDVEVFALPVVTFTALADLCIDAGVQVGEGGGTPTGGVYSGAGVTDNGDGETYDFDPATAGVGVHTITYTYTDANGCTDSASDDVEVFDLPMVDFTAPADICINEGVQTGLSGGTPTGGVYSGPGVTDDGNGETYSFDPEAAGAGVHTLTYTYTDGNGCTNSASDDIEVFGLSILTFEAPADLCIDAGVQTGLNGGTPPGGVYSGTGVTDDGNGMTYSFDPGVAGIGVHTITYTFVDMNGCTNTISDDVEVYDLPTVDFTAPDDLCINEGVQTGLSGGTPAEGVYSGTGVTDDGNGITYSFDPTAGGAGVYTITYTYTDANGCINSASDDVEVFGLSIVEFTAPADLCIDAGVQAGLGGGTPTGGVYSGSGVTDDGNGMTYSFDPATAGVGVHTITYSFTDANGCTNTASDDVEVIASPVVEFTAPMDICVDAGVQAGLDGGTPTGGVYSGPGVTDNGDGETYDFDPAAAGVGVHTITYDYTDGNGCTGSASDDVEVFDLPSVTFNAGADLCIDAGVQTGQGSGVPQGGVYSGPGVTDDGNGMTYSFDPAAAGVGVHTITYTYNDTNGCTGTFSDDIEVFDLPVVSFTAPADLCIDAGVQAGLGGGTPTGGVYSGAGVTDNGDGETYDFDPATAGAGVHTITYTYTDGNGCTNSASDDVEVFALPVVAFTAPADLCIDAGVQAGLGGGTPTGGIYSGPGVTDNGDGETYDFDPATAGVGVHTITYTYTDGNGCTGSASDDVEVFALPVVTFTALADLCVDAGVQAGEGGGTPTGGVYSGPGVTDNGDGETYDFDPATAGVGVHTITYTYTDGNGCTDSASDDVEVFALPVVTFTALADLCVDAGVQAGLGGGTPTGGVYSGAGVTDNGDGETYDFDPAAAGAGVHTLTYTYTDGNGCTNTASDDVEVFALPVVEFTAPMDICVDAGVQAGLSGGTPTGGVYSGPGVTDNGDGETYDFDPAAAGVGVHTITYTYTDGNGCTNSASDDVEVFDLPSVTFNAGADLCIDAGVQTGQGSGVPQGGVYSGPGVTDDGNGMTYSFDPAAAGVGVHTITYTYNDTNGCTGTFSDDIEVFDLPVVAFTAPADLCIDAGVQAGLGGGTPTGGVYSGAGVTDNGDGETYDFDPATAGAGVHTITYTYTDGNGCTNSASDDVEVFALPVVAFTAPADLCVDAGVQAGLGGGTPTGGIYSGPGVTDNGDGETYDFDPAAAGVGVHTITYDYTDGNGCSGSASDDVEVFDTPIVDLVTEPYHCLDAEIQNLPMSGGIPTGGVYSGTGITDNGNGISYFIDPTVNGVGTVTVTYTYTDENGCSSSATSDIEIIDCDVTNSFEVDDPCQCLDNATPFDCNNNTGGDDGQFSELVTVSAAGGPLPNGMTWSVVGAVGAFDEFNVPAYGMQSAGVPTPGDGSVLLAYNAVDGVYEIPFVHVDDIGYSLTIEGPFAMGSAANITFTVSNKCQYPDPEFDPVVPFVIKTTDPVITLGGTDTNGGTADMVSFTINGNPETELDPAALGVGFHTVNMVYDGAADGNGGVSPDGGTTSASPGCIQEVTKEIEIKDCDLVVDCSNVVDETIACIADLPPVDLTLPIIVDSCGVVTVTEETVVPPNTGCPNDTLFVTRSYFVEDATGLKDTCMQTFTVISTMDPVFTFFPGDTTVLCGADTDPAATGMAQGAGECDPATPQAVVTFDDAITPGSCPAEMTITRTWTVTDRCGRSVEMDQMIMVVDTIAPMMVCQNITVELDANGMATADPNDVDNGSSDNCGGPVALSLSMDMFTCANLGANDVWLIGEDECGNQDSCMAVITVEDNIAPTIVCPGDMVLDNDPGVCGATVTYDIIADDNCDFTVMQTSGIPSGGFYPVGDTITNTFVVTDEAGLTAECSFTVIVNDVEGPVIDCPSDINIQLEPGECEEVVLFDIPFMDNCGSIDAEASQAVNESLVSTALDCFNNTSNHLRYFENDLLVPIDITEVNFGVFNSGANETVTVNVYMIGPGAPFTYANMVLMGTTDHMVPSGMNQVIITAPVEATIPVGMNYVLELKANNTANFVIGYNTSGETESTYISGNPPVPCVSLEPTDIDGLGPFGNFAVILYSNAEGGPTLEQTGGLPSGAYFPIGTTTNTFIATDVYGNTTECTFDVNVFEYDDGVTGVMACNDLINVSLDQNCELILGADMLLEGDVYGCYDDYIIEVSGGVVGNVITDPGTYTVTITDPDTGNSCWSTINVESKALPQIDCASALCPIDMLTGEWTEDDNTFSPGAAWAFDGFPPNANILYDVIEFVVVVPGMYTFTMTPSDEFDGIAGIYAGSFDPDMPALNLIGGDDDIPGVFESEPDFTIQLEAGTYFLVSSTWGAGQMGVYSWTFTGPGDLLSDCEIKCYELDALISGDLDIPAPEVTSCIPFELFYSDNVDVDECGITTVTRTYVAENANGTSSCEVTFEIEPLSVALDITLPISPVILSCNDGTDPEDIVAIFDNPLTTDNPNTAIVENNEGYVYAYPTYVVNGHPQKIDNNVCNVYAGYTDQELEACEEGCNGNRKVIRTWTLVDWCTLEISNFIQTIKAVDTEAPTLITKDVTVSTDAWGCEASFEAPLPWELHDNCDSNPEYSISGPAGVTIEGSFEDGYFISGAPKGTHTFNYVAYDCCGNEASYPFTVTVLDLTPPVVVAKQNVVVSLTSGSTSEDGLAKLYAESIDNGSYDGCSSNVKLEIRRDEDNCDIRGNATYNADGHPQDGSPNPNSPSYDPDGGAFVKFCCADLTNAVVDVNGDGENDPGYVKVWLRVWDDGDMDGIFGTSGDNYNEAWAFVKVEDKLAPAIQCPPDVTLTCDMDYTDLNMTGSASAFGSCGGVEVEYNDIIVNLNSCNEGFVRRRWSVVDRSDIFCDQTITLEDLNTPVNVSFSQVGDFTAANCPDMIALGEPTWVAGPCDVLGYTLETDTFKFEDGACYKLVNHWTVINWCDYDPNNPFWNGEGLWEHTQVIKVTDETKPVIEDCEDKMFAINDHSDSDDDGEVCEAKITLTNVATDEGSENCPTGWLKWQVFVDLWGDGTDDLEYSSFLPPFDTQFNDTNGNGVPDVYVSPTANGETVSIPLPDIAGSMSNHKVRWKVTDGCNNVTTCDNEFMVVDKKAPTPYCVDLSTAVMESSGTVELWAIDFNVGSFDNCTAQENLRYTFTDVAPEDDANYDPAQRSSSKVFDCGDVENSPVEVNMYVWDEKGNADFCVVYLTIVDNTGACGGKPEIGGTVATESGTGVTEVEVTLEAALPEYPRTEMTDEEGIYVFEENALNASYQISGSKDIDYMNGVSTLDLVKIQRHILGLEELDSPYKLVAADVNADDQIKASDLTQLRKLILGVITDLPTNESWRFVDGDQTMSMDMDLADINYTLEINNIQGNSFDNDFVAVKVGDVTENAVANLLNTTTEVRSSKTLELMIENQVVEAGQKVSVDFTSEDFEDVFGYQFTMELNGLTFAGIESGAVEMQEGNVGLLSDNVLTMSYNHTTGVTAGKEAIFTIDFIATENGNLSEMIDITSKVTRSEAYVGSTLEIRDVVISTRGDIVEVEATELYQNEPNPFKGQTTVGFNLAEAGAATMTVFDVTGKVIVKRNIDGVRGYNTVNFTANQLGVSGVLYYTLESGDFTATKKMIVIE